MEQPQKRKVVAKVTASNVYSPASSSRPAASIVGGPSNASALSPPNGIQPRVRVNSSVSAQPRPLSPIVGGEPTPRRGSTLAARASTSRDGTPTINGYSSASEAPRIMLRPAVSSAISKSQTVPTTINNSASNISTTTTRPTVRSQPTLPPKARVAVASAGTKPTTAASMPSSPHIQPTFACIQIPHSTPEVSSAPTSPTTHARHLPPTSEISSPLRPNGTSTSNSRRVKSKVILAHPSQFPHTRTASVGSMTAMQALLSPPQQLLPLSVPSNLLSPATAPATPIFRPKAKITHIIHGPSNDELATSPPTSTLSSRSSTRSTSTVASSVGSSQFSAGTPRGRPPSTMGLGMVLGPRRPGSRGEDVSDCEYEGRLGTLQESIREGHVYLDDEDAAGGDLLKPPSHTHNGEVTSTSEAEKDDNENEDEDEEGGKSKYTKGVIIDGMGEVQIVDIELIREEEEAKASRKVLDLEISNKSLSTLNAILEATKARQAREIKELKRKMREMRHLPPSLSLATGPPVPPPLHSPRSTTSSLHRDSPSSSDSEDSEDEGDKPDPTFDHIKSMLETLLAEGIRAIERTQEECVPDDEVKEDGERRIKGSGGAKVLSPAELLEYRRARGEVVEEHEHEATEAETIAEGSGAEDEHP